MDNYKSADHLLEFDGDVTTEIEVANGIRGIGYAILALVDELRLQREERRKEQKP